MISERIRDYVLTQIEDVPAIDCHDEWDDERCNIARFQKALDISGYSPGKIDGLIGRFTSSAFIKWAENPKRLKKLFGQAMSTQCTEGVLKLPFDMKYAGQKISKLNCNKFIVKSASRALERIKEEYTQEQIQYYGFNITGGCYSPRYKRGSRNSLSMHAWGIAIDFDPSRNKLKWRSNKANFARKECQKFFDVWEEEGFFNLGRIRGYDWMHMQAYKGDD